MSADRATRYLAAPSKSDPGDGMLADVLRTDGPRPDPDQRCDQDPPGRGRDDLVSERIALGNRLQARSTASGLVPPPSEPALRRPEGPTRGADLTSPIDSALLERHPTPRRAARLGEKRLAAFLARRARCHRRTPAELLGRLRQAPPGCAGEAESAAKAGWSAR